MAGLKVPMVNLGVSMDLSMGKGLVRTVLRELSID
jgi:hypothetical protein